MSKFHVELKSEGVRELLKSAEMGAICRELAEGIARRAGSGYLVTTHVGVNRVNASVMTDTKEAKQDNMKNNTLLKAMG